jgi:Arc/MetJ-type ribon-helix-helix transcriptional regulator
MARFMISMPDEMLKKLDEAARKEHRSRSELLREATRRHLSADSQATSAQTVRPRARRKIAKQMAGGSVKERLLELELGQNGCPGLDRLIGPVHGTVDIRRLLKISKKLNGLSRDIIEARNDRS